MSTRLSRIVGGSASTLLLTAVLATTAGSASARPDAGPPVPQPQTSTSSSCSLERVGTQFIRCDDLTGNSAPAPAFIRQR